MSAEVRDGVGAVVLGGGVRMFPELGGDQVELERSRVVESATVTHLQYRVSRPTEQPHSPRARGTIDVVDGP